MQRARSAALFVCVAGGCGDGGCRIDESEVVDVLARSYCDGVYAHCGGGPGVSETSCDSRMTRGGEAVREELSALAFRYDGDCALALRETYESDEPDDPRLPGQPHPLACSLWVGTRGEGDACSRVSGFDECAPPFSCDALGRCIRPRSPIAEGESCFDVDVELPCEAGLACNFGVCTEPPEAGQPCAHTCAPGAMCDLAADTCVAAPARGEPCDGECGVGLECIDEICETARPAVCAVGPPWPPA